jgi:hypothetical protein
MYATTHIIVTFGFVIYCMGALETDDGTAFGPVNTAFAL